MAVDWGKYGVNNEEEEEKRKASSTTVDFSKYQTTPEVPETKVYQPKTEAQEQWERDNGVSPMQILERNRQIFAPKIEAGKIIKEEEKKKKSEKPSFIERVNKDLQKFPPILRPLAAVPSAISEITKPAQPFLESVITPGGGPAAVAGLTKGTAYGISKLLPKLNNSGAGRIATTALSEAAVGAPLGASNMLARNPEASAKEIGVNAGLGAAGGAVLGGLARGGSEGLASLRRTAEKSVGNKVNAAGALNKVENAPQYSGNLKLDDKGQNVSRIMEDIRPAVNEAMTPPLESEKALRAWIKPILGNPSNNELAKLTYDDLVEIATEARKGMNTYDTAVNVAKARGIDLEQAFKQAPSIRASVPRDASRRAYGAPTPNLPNVTRPLKKQAEPDVPADPGTPAKLHWFERLFGDEGVGITPFGSNRSNNIITTEQQIVNSPLKNNVSGLLNQGKQLARGGFHNTVDMLSPLKTINKATYDSALDAARANNISNNIIRDKFIDLEGNVVGGSLNDMMKQSRSLGKKLDDYIVLRHAITRMGRGERVYDDALQMTPQKAQQAVDKLEERYPMLKTIGQDWNKFNENLLDNYGVKEGLISQGARDAMRSENPNYASMRRQFTIGEKMAQPKFGGSGSSFSGQNAPIKEVSPTGSTRRIVSPLRSAIEQTYAWTNAALRNRSMQEIVKAIQKDPEALKGVAEIVKKPSTSYKSLDDALRDGGSEEFLELLDNDFKSLFRKSIAGEENIVRAMVNGNPVFIKVHNPEAVKALTGLGSEQAGIILDVMQKLSNATKRGATGLFAPMFAIKSLGADSIQAAIQSPNAFKHLAVDLPHAFISSLANILPGKLKIPGLKNLAEDFRRSGGEYSSLLRGERQLKTSIRDLRREPLLSGMGMAKGAINTIKAPFKALEKIADTSENMNRMAAFRRAMKGKERTPENVRNALNAARESTVNFSRKGAFARESESVIPYQNAAIQGIYRLARSFKDPKTAAKTIAGLGTLVVIPKLLEYAKFNDDPDYQKIPARERYRHVIYGKNADGTFKKQFLPPEYSAFASFITDVMSDVINKDPQAYKGTLDALANAYTPPIVSGALQGVTQGEEAGKGEWEKSLWGAANATVIAPFAATGANQSFTGAPIVPKRLEGNSAEFQYDERTSNIAREIGKRIGLAPLKVDYLIRAYGGDPARLLLPLNSPAGAGTPRNTLLKNFIVDPVFTNTLSSDFYAAKEKFTKAKNDYIDHGKEPPAWYSEEAEKFINSTSKNSITKMISTLNEEKRAISGDKELNAKEKTRQLREVQSQINEIYTDVNSTLSEAGFKFPNR